MSDGKAINGKGRLTNIRIDALQSLYGYVLKSNKGNAKNMARGVQAILHHYSSTEENPQHQFCPKGKFSWCKFQADKATGSKTYRPLKDPIPAAVKEIIQPVFTKLGDVKFLESCKNNMSSNPNEAYHHVLWGLAPKDSFCSTKEIQLAVDISVCLFNSGYLWTYQTIFEKCNLPFSENAKNMFRQMDIDRIKKSDYHSSEKQKKRRKDIRHEKHKSANAFQKKDTMNYKSGEFYNT